MKKLLITLFLSTILVAPIFAAAPAASPAASLENPAAQAIHSFGNIPLTIYDADSELLKQIKTYVNLKARPNTRVSDLKGWARDSKGLTQEAQLLMSIEHLAEFPVHINHADNQNFGRSPFMFLAATCNADLIKDTIDKADISHKDLFGLTALELAQKSYAAIERALFFLCEQLDGPHYKASPDETKDKEKDCRLLKKFAYKQCKRTIDLLTERHRKIMAKQELIGLGVASVAADIVNKYLPTEEADTESLREVDREVEQLTRQLEQMEPEELEALMNRAQGTMSPEALKQLREMAQDQMSAEEVEMFMDFLKK